MKCEHNLPAQHCLVCIVLNCEHGIDPFICPVLGCQAQTLDKYDPIISAEQPICEHGVTQGLCENCEQDTSPTNKDLYLIKCEEIVESHFDILQRLDDLENALDDLKGV